MTPQRAVFSVLLALSVSTPPFAQTSQTKPGAAAVEVQASKPATASVRTAAPGSLAPLPVKPSPASSHAPFEAGDCKICHQNADPKQPGPVVKKGPGLCIECHEEFAAVMQRPHTHAPARGDCTSCHNPHNAKFPKLLLQEPRALCTNCHDKIGKIAGNAPVPHKAVTSGAQCTNCHNPHASAVEKLLVQLPFDLCVSCHKVDTMADVRGKKLQNIKAWLDNNKNWHGPVAAKDCSACHEPHGGDHFRLLKADYPQEFYASYDPRAYELCFSCHQESAFSTAQTTTLTSFRNGATNLHYLHLQQSGRGRTCRACHEVHASNQDNHIREGVPYGSGGWMLKLHFKKAPNGGSCEKTCHSEKSYVNKDGR
jgi:predicted CXXCH cytochrome family protein